MNSAVSAAGMMNCQTDMPGRARHDQLQLAGEVDEGRHGAEQHGEGQNHFGRRRHFHGGHQRDRAGAGGRIVACAAQHLDEDDDEHQAEDREEDRQDRAHETHGEIAR